MVYTDNLKETDKFSFVANVMFAKFSTNNKQLLTTLNYEDLEQPLRHGRPVDAASVFQVAGEDLAGLLKIDVTLKCTFNDCTFAQ